MDDVMLRNIINSLRPDNTELASRVSAPALIGWYYRKAAGPAFRGLLLSPFFRRTDLPIFIGRRASIAYKNHLTLGRGVYLGADVSILALSSEGITLARGVTIRERAWIQCSSHPANPGVGLTVGRGTYIGPNAVIGVGGRITIGEGCQIGANFVVVAENHAQSEDGTPSTTNVVRQGISIGDNCWLGHGVTVLDGVSLGAGTTVGAGAVVTRSFPPNTKIAGVPARELA